MLQINRHLELRLFEHVKFDGFVELFEIRGPRVKRPALDVPMTALLNDQPGRLKLTMFANLPGDFRCGGRAVGTWKISGPGIPADVTGGHVDAAMALRCRDIVRDEPVWRVAVAKQRSQTVGGEHLGSSQRKFAPEKPRVVAKDNSEG